MDVRLSLLFTFALLPTAPLLSCRDPPAPLPPQVKLIDSQKSVASDLVAAAVARIAKAEERRDAGFEHAAQTARATNAPCSVTREGLGIRPDITTNGLTSQLLGMTRVILPDSKKAQSGVASKRLASDLYSINQKLDGTLGYGETAERFLDETKRLLDSHVVGPYELALVMDRFDDPELLGDKAFRAGSTRGRLYLWSEAAGAVICTSDAAGQSASEVTVRTNAGASQQEIETLTSARLTGELLVRTIDDGIDALHAVEPTELR